jgi:glycosyltransferase involved in cell wall biosynthesis
MPRNLSACDFGIFFYHPGNSGEGVSPTKFGEYLAAGLPVIANPDLGDVEDIVKRTGCGILVNPDSLESMNDAVAKMEREKFRDRDYFLKVAAEEFGMEKALDKYESVYQKLM